MRATSDKVDTHKPDTSKGLSFKPSPSLPSDIKSNFGKQNEKVEKDSRFKVEKITSENEELVVSEEENEGGKK